MRLLQSAAATFVAVCLSASTAFAAPVSYSEIYSFGDSLSDVGNVYTLSNNNIPVSPPYAPGRFSNGNVWLQDLAPELGLGPIRPSLQGGNDYAYGGAQTGATIAHNVAPIDLTSQLTQFQAQTPNPVSGALYTLWIGANDINAFVTDYLSGQGWLSDPDAFIAQATSNVGNVVDGLSAGGLQTLLALDVPDLSKTPNAVAAANSTSDPDASLAQIGLITRAFNDALAETLEDAAQRNGFDLILGETFDRIDNIVANPGDFGFTNATDPCYTGGFVSAESSSVCDDPDSYLFWDRLHPTRAGHQIVADVALQELRANATSVPEPGGVLLFAIAILALGAASAHRRRGGMNAG